MVKQENQLPVNNCKALLAVKNLTVEYKTGEGKIRALHDISFTLSKTENLGIIGESGSGKTTLALSLLGLIGKPHSVTGSIMLSGEDILSLSEEEKKKLRWSRIALVFQNALEILNPVLTIGEQIGETLRYHRGLTGKALEQELQMLFNLVGLEYFWHRAYPHQLSGGMRQRVLLAMAISCQPEVLVVDEPTSSLDALARKEIMGMLKDLQRKIGFAMIVISHDLAVMEELAEDLLVLYSGEVMESGATIPLIDRPLHPYTRGLLNSSVEIHPYKDLWGIPGEAAEGWKEDCCVFAGRCTQVLHHCLNEKPPLLELDTGRMVRCHRGGIFRLLEAERISKTFSLNGHRIEALKKINLNLYHGETAALVGATGSGKSTLAHILAGLDFPDSGKAVFDGHPIRDGEAHRRERGIQLVMQDPFSSVSHRLRVFEAVAEPLVINKICPPAIQMKRVREALKAVQLPNEEGFLKRYCHALSGGQRQRLAIARALVMKPALLLADEITSMLDVSTQANLMRLLKGLQYSFGFTMLYITHDLSLARKISERIIVLHEGRVVEEGPATKVAELSSCSQAHTLMSAGLHRHYHYHEHDHIKNKDSDHIHEHIHDFDSKQST
ncbi:MAG TPA: dipeptide ABC transporter ATP-binding protein [Firmicutes bacterium]|nr:dipeptide ABC transporter ATP-binding protein [Bacillota bacterium]